VAGGDGFIGWPLALRLSNIGHEVLIVDNLSRRQIDLENGYCSVTPIASIQERLEKWKALTGKTITFAKIDIALQQKEF
jgi:UDP-sulfoquinovose synthase